MKLRIDLLPVEESLIPISYQELLNQSIYNLIRESSIDFNKFLREEGYKLRYKHFRMFTFSFLFIKRNYEVKENNLVVRPTNVLYFYISSPINELLHYLLNSLLKRGYISIGSNNFKVANIDALLNPKFSNKMLVIPESVVVFSTRREDKTTEFLTNNWEKISHNATINLQDKYLLLTGKSVKESVTLKSLTNIPETKLIAYKNIRIKGILNKMIIEGDSRLIETAYHTGLGEKNSMGFGCVKMEGT